MAIMTATLDKVRVAIVTTATITIRGCTAITTACVITTRFNPVVREKLPPGKPTVGRIRRRADQVRRPNMPLMVVRRRQRATLPRCRRAMVAEMSLVNVRTGAEMVRVGRKTIVTLRRSVT
jgi:hypothetical protein